MKANFQSAVPYAEDAMNLPVEDAEAALPFYHQVMGFQIVSRQDSPLRRAILARDAVQIGLAENGGDPGQEGCFFAVDDVEAAWAELKSNGLEQEAPSFRIDQHGEKTFKVFFIIAPDGLCFCLGRQQ